MLKTKLLSILIFFILNFICLEILSFFAFYYYKNEVYYLKPANVNQDKLSNPYTAAEAVFHPYYAYLHRVGRQGGWWTTNNVGFQVLTDLIKKDPGCCDYPFVKDDNDIVVAIFGGSVAAGFSLALQKHPEWAQLLSKNPAWNGKRIRILNFAMPGFKQPQQFITLSYWLSLGQQFDLILNIDGFNEVVTSYKNWESGVEPSFPADTLWGSWGRQLDRSAFKDESHSAKFYLAAWHRTEEKEWKLRSENCLMASCFWFSQLISNYSSFRAKRLEIDIQATQQKISLFPTEINSKFSKNFNIHEHTTHYWRSSSKAMSALARDNGSIYLHVLQPNQWWKNSGSYTPLVHDHQYKWVIPLVNDGYPKLVESLSWLNNKNVNTLDATTIFREKSSRDVYIDDCCHFTDNGNEILASKIAEKLVKYLNP